MKFAIIKFLAIYFKQIALWQDIQTMRMTRKVDCTSCRSAIPLSALIMMLFLFINITCITVSDDIAVTL